MATHFGIDFGTSRVRVAALTRGEARVLAVPGGPHGVAAVVAWRAEGQRLVGDAALAQAILDPAATVSGIKGLLGRTWAQVAPEAARLPWRVEEGPGGAVRVVAGHRRLAPEQVAAMLLRRAVDDAERALGAPITAAVLGVPACFSDAARRALRAAARIAGLVVPRLLSEPVATLLAHAARERVGRTVLVFDLGGGVLDVAVADVGAGACEVRATAGDPCLGAARFDEAVAAWLAEQHGKGADALRADRQAWARLLAAAAEARVELSATGEAAVRLPFLAGRDLELTLSRAQLGELASDTLGRCGALVERALAEAGVSPGELDGVVLAGGACRVPAVRHLLGELTGGVEPLPGPAPEDAVALGAATQAALLGRAVPDVLVLDVTGRALVASDEAGATRALVARQTTIPCRRHVTLTTGRAAQRGVELRLAEQAADGPALPVGTFRASGLPSGAAGAARAEVIVDVDADGIVAVAARDADTSRPLPVERADGPGLSEADVLRLAAEALEIEEGEQARRRHADVLAQLESLSWRAAAALARAGERVPADDRARAERLLLRARAELAGAAPADRLQEGINELEQVIHALDVMGRQAGATVPTPEED